MNYFDDELRIIQWFQDVEDSEVSFLQHSEEAELVFRSVRDTDKWKHWKNSSGKSDPPPDFFSDKYGLMMDVMRIDDHTRLIKRGRSANPVNQRESIIQKELRESGLLDSFPNLEGVFVNAITDLPTQEDHNYQFYYTAFERTVKKHIESIPLYKENHPGHKVIFFIFDESSGYVQVESKELAQRGIKRGEVFEFCIYLHFLDKRFIDVFRGSDIDYVICFSPFKHFESTYPYPIPSVCVFDVKNYNYEDIVEYPEELIVSTED